MLTVQEAELLFAEMMERHWCELSVEWEVRWVSRKVSPIAAFPGHWYFSCFQNHGAKGNGAIALRAVCALADQTGFQIVLWTEHQRLYDYYESFGFERGRRVLDHMYFRRRPVVAINPA